MWLTSKLTRPTPPASTIPRPQLDAELDKWPRYRLVLVRAAAGYGKSSLVSAWLAKRDDAIAWLSLDPNESDPVQFVRYFAAALDNLSPGAVDVIEPILQDLEPNATQAMTNLLAALPTSRTADAPPMLVILDDYHRAESAAVNALMNLILERAPDSLHLMILSRDLPKLSLARLVVTGSLLELTNDDLRFNGNEIEQFLKTIDMPTLSSEQTRQILERSEGWVTGLKMAGLSLADRHNPEQFLSHLHGASQWQSAYLADEVLNQQPAEMQRFLLETSILDQLCGPLCENVTGIDSAPKLLAGANAAGLFLVPLDNRRVWYRYHHLFQEMLLTRLTETYSAATIRKLHLRAAAWHESENDLVQAVEHYLAAGRTDTAAVLLNRLVRQAIEINDLHTAESLLGRLPDGVVDREPSLLLSLAWINLARNDMELFNNTARAERALEQVDPADPARPEMEGRLAVLQMGGAIIQRRMDDLQGFTETALKRESLLDERNRAMLWYLRFVQALLHSDWDQAEIYGNRAIAAFELAHDDVGLISVRREMAVRQFHSGRATMAARDLDEVISAYPLPQPNLVLRDLQYTLVQAAEVYYWLNDMERLRQRARAAAEMAHQLGDTRALVLAGQLLDLYNLSNPADPDIDFVKPRPLVLGEGGLFPFHPVFETIYQVRQGNSNNAMLIADAFNLRPTTDPTTVSTSRMPVLALAYVSAGRDLVALDDLMTYALQSLGKAKNLYLLGQMQAIEAWRQQRIGHKAAAIRALAAAVDTVAKTGLVRAILDIPALAPLLDSVKHPRAAMLAAMMEPAAQDEALGPTTVRPSEIRVLELLAHDYRYEEIAERLSVSPHTVRTHIKSIYRKLGVTRRMAAVEVARQAGLIE